MVVACAICGCQLKDGQKLLEYSYHGRPYILCTLECLHIFEQFPDAYGDDAVPEVQLVDDQDVH
jgi:YHS domain-containing protein